MANPHTLHPRVGDAHVFVVRQIEATQGVTTAGAIRWLIEQYAMGLEDPRLADVVPEEARHLVPTLWTIARDAAEAGRKFSLSRDAEWIGLPHEMEDEPFVEDEDE